MVDKSWGICDLAVKAVDFWS